MLLTPLWFLITVAVAVSLRDESTSFSSSVDTSTLKGKWLYGYQGWFRKPASGVNNHWSPSGTPGPGNRESPANQMCANEVLYELYFTSGFRLFS
jgi:hypothetical protein